jgi:predicted lipoprotein with Yx(FWY)xxD motif
MRVVVPEGRILHPHGQALGEVVDCIRLIEDPVRAPCPIGDGVARDDAAQGCHDRLRKRSRRLFRGGQEHEVQHRLSLEDRRPHSSTKDTPIDPWKRPVGGPILTRRMKRVVAIAVAAVLAGALLLSTTALGRGAAVSVLVRTAYNAKLKATIVVDGKGRTLYMFTADISGTPNCAAVHPDCPKVWPAFASPGKPRAGAGIKASLLGVTKGAGGVRQVTYNRHPLYYFRGGFGTGTGDRAPGHVRGQGVQGVWYVVSAKGTPIRKNA